MHERHLNSIADYAMQHSSGISGIRVVHGSLFSALFGSLFASLFATHFAVSSEDVQLWCQVLKRLRTVKEGH